MKIFFLINCLSAALLLISGCKSDSKDDAEELFLPVAAENAVLCEASATHTHVTLLPLLDSLLPMNVNALCVPPPGASEANAFKDFMDSCHQRGLSVLLHAGTMSDANVELVKTYDVDGFHFPNRNNASDADWATKLDALYGAKGLLIVADSLPSSLYDVGFGAFKSSVFENALVAVIDGSPLGVLDSALAYERKAIPKEMRVMRNLPSSRSAYDSTNAKMREAVMMATYAVQGLPVNTTEMLARDVDFLKTFNGLYVNSPALQYGAAESMERVSEGIYVIVRVHEEERILIAVNLRDKPMAYKWPSNLSRSNTELMMGEALTMSGGQELPAYGYQMLRFKYLEGMQPLDMDNK